MLVLGRTRLRDASWLRDFAACVCLLSFFAWVGVYLRMGAWGGGGGGGGGGKGIMMPAFFFGLDYSRPEKQSLQLTQ